jgi:hypothetical protein
MRLTSVSKRKMKKKKKKKKDSPASVSDCVAPDEHTVTKRGTISE